MEPEIIEVIDSHTGGEPTRVIVAGGPELGSGPLAERLARFRDRFDHLRTRVMNEPRGSEAWVGALLCEPHDSSCDFGVIFFNNVGYLGMCGHGTIGLIETLRHQGRIEAGAHRIDSPVGPVTAMLHADRTVSVFNVRSYRHAADVQIEVPGVGAVTGDIAWGGNWFFLVRGAPPCPLEIGNEPDLKAAAIAIRSALVDQGMTGKDDGYIDHIEFFGPPADPANHSRNYVLCPGGAYDRSPCGTGTSAKLSCLAADGKLGPGELWLQESLIGSVFQASYAPAPENTGGGILPEIRGAASISAVSQLVFDPRDPFPNGIPT
ncbi:MAG: 4-hydroxyproline epimerase [Planctomycetota bacterium]